MKVGDKVLVHEEMAEVVSVRKSDGCATVILHLEKSGKAMALVVTEEVIESYYNC